MAAAPFRPPWFAHPVLPVVAGGAALYNAVQLVLRLVDGLWGEAFLSFAWCAVFGYVMVESLRFRREQEAAQAAADEGTRPPVE